jgi:hypothetical protein
MLGVSRQIVPGTAFTRNITSGLCLAAQFGSILNVYIALGIHSLRTR